jgi:hypothetical protein
MKNKNFLLIYGFLVAVYESYHFISGIDFIEPQFKGAVAILSFAGLVLKNIYEKNKQDNNSNPSDRNSDRV